MAMVKRSSELVLMTGDAFKENVTIYRKLGTFIEEVAAASEEQSQGISHIGQAVAEIDKVVQDTAANAEESASASEEMSSMALAMDGNVVALVNLFTGQNGTQRETNDAGKTRVMESKKTILKHHPNTAFAKGTKSARQILRTVGADKVFSLIAAFLFLSSGSALAVNGDILIGIGPISRSMGGVGIASPQDVVSAIASNPAGMSFAPYSAASQMDFGASFINPHANSTTVSSPAGTVISGVNEQFYLAPAIGLSVPITDQWPNWRFGLAAFGASGLGVDYKGTALDQPNYFAPHAPLMCGTFAEIQVLKIAPTVSAQLSDRFAVGFSLHIDHGSLNLGSGTSSQYGLGFQIGAVYKLTNSISVGLTYVSPQNINYKRIGDLDGDGTVDDLEVESPQQVGLGLSYTALQNKLLLETNVRWINWGSANGYSDFDWQDQWLFKFGAQYFITPKLALRGGYNYAQSQVKEHNGFNGATPSNTTNVQGKNIPTYYYETLRPIGFPAFVEHHITIGLGYQFTPRFGVNVAYVHEFDNTFRESGTGFAGPTTIENKVSVDSYDLGLTWRF
jgi:long-chain fatty acid transport protein